MEKDSIALIIVLKPCMYYKQCECLITLISMSCCELHAHHNLSWACMYRYAGVYSNYVYIVTMCVYI